MKPVPPRLDEERERATFDVESRQTAGLREDLSRDGLCGPVSKTGLRRASSLGSARKALHTVCLERAGDRGRTGDVQLGKLIEEGPEDYDPWG
jgi:hypothetical protein